MKKIITLIFIIAATVQFAIGQTATVTLADYTAPPGLVTIPVEYTNFVDIGAVTLFFEYDQSVASYSSFNAGDLNGALVSTWQSSGNTYILGISWTDINGLSSASGTLLELVFNYSGGTTALDFQANCEIGNLAGNVVPALYTDGSLSPDPNTVPITIESLLNLTPASPPNNYVEVPVMANFSNVPNTGVGSFNFEIKYDNNILTFDQLTMPFVVGGFTVNVLTNPARVSVAWTTPSTSGSTINGTLFKLKFTYDGGNSDLSFNTSACAVADYGANPLSALYTDGMVTQNPATGPNVIIGSVSSLAGTTVLVPVTVQNFETYVPNFGAFDFSIGFNSANLQFTQLLNVDPKISTGLTYNTITDQLNISWNATTSGITFADNDLLFNLEFYYTGTNQDIVFNTDNCIMADWDVNPIYGFYFDGQVTEIPGNVSLCMQDIVAPLGGDALMPLIATGFSDIGAITLEVQFNNTLINYISIESENALLTSKGSSLYSGGSGTFTYSWTINGSETVGLSIPDGEALFNIKFLFIAGPAPVTFNTPICEIATFDAVSIPVSYCDGQITNGAEVEIKAFLKGAYNPNTSLMNTTLKTAGLIPLTQPYGVAPWNYSGTESVTSIPADVVDWVLVEVRTGTSKTTVVERRAAFLLANGDIVQYDNVNSGVIFYSIIPTNQYYLVIWHRNHIPVMSGLPVVLPNPGNPYDFTEVVLTTPYLHNSPNPAELELGASGSGLFGMISGDINADGKIAYLGPNNDRDYIPQRLTIETGSPYVNVIAPGYFSEDVNFSGTVSYLGMNNDRDIITQILFLTTGSNLVNVIYETVVPGALNP